jgi:hypothetical protein
MYTPLLRNRQSEMLSLKHLGANVKPLLVPLIDIAAPSRSLDRAAAELYVAKRIAHSGNVASGLSTVLIDSSELDPDFRLAGDQHPLDAAAIAMAAATVRAIPVTGLHRDDAHRTVAAGIARKHDAPRLCIRLDGTDVSTATLTMRGILDLASEASLTTNEVIVLLDLQCLWNRDIQVVSVELSRLLRLLDAHAWAGIVVGGYGFPDQLSTACTTNSEAYLRRVEQDLFYGVSAAVTKSPAWFADYTVVSPSSVELDVRLINRLMSPKAMYTLESEWFVVRGGAFSSHPDSYGQYYALADEIVALAEFSGPAFSYGDKYIHDRHLRSGKPGSPRSWITACVNHHVTFTALAHRR